MSILAEGRNTEPLISHLERSGDDGGCVETRGQVEGTCGWHRRQCTKIDISPEWDLRNEGCAEVGGQNVGIIV